MNSQVQLVALELLTESLVRQITMSDLCCMTICRYTPSKKGSDRTIRMGLHEDVASRAEIQCLVHNGLVLASTLSQSTTDGHLSICGMSQAINIVHEHVSVVFRQRDS